MVSMRKVYLSKSNRANPDHVTMIRRHLERLGYEIIEHQGGEYDRRLLFDCKIMVMVGIERPSQNAEGIVKIGKGQYQQLKNRRDHAPASTLRNLYFTHTETDDESGREIPMFKQVINKCVIDADNWTTGYGLLKVKMDSHTKLTNFQRPKATIDGGQDMMKQADVKVVVQGEVANYDEGIGNDGQVFVKDGIHVSGDKNVLNTFDPRTRWKHLACITLFK